MNNVKLKICGVKTISETQQLKDSGIDYIGLNFVPSSSRCLTLDQAQAIVDVLKDSAIQTVALFANQPIGIVNAYAIQLGVDYIQLHGDEAADYARGIEVPVIRAIAVDPASSAGSLIDLINNYPADYFVLDRRQQGQGDTVDLNLVNQIIAAQPTKICLAGGLNPDNLTVVLAHVHPYAIDISSGVRSGDVIDMAKVRRCLEIIRLAAD
jgi:phosphoribosylanthranilate isomerase